ncbi:sialate O-acetylesterase [Flavobacterium sp. N1994]|uniref:sialate O-acetylesterase n=1 Tax=Flavobacterium sp. N1994 TaxID=2986827 RepID=UPI002222AC60|nr:sialate O-acetylesterase [Flavobacterium sp. N1994]
MKILFKIVFFLLCNYIYGAVQLPLLFSDNMVLQQNSKVNFWGKALSNEKIRINVDWQKNEYTTNADSQGNWQISIVTTKASFKEHTISIKGTNEIVLHNVLLGEVWFSCGQSNMELVMRKVKDADQEMKEADYPNIRLFNVKKKKADDPQTDIPEGSKWEPCSPQSVKEFSAMSYYFARKMQQELDVPIGIITANWGGTGAECWTPSEKMKGNPVLKNIYSRWNQWEIDKVKDSIAFVEVKGLNPKQEEPRSVYMTKRQHRRPAVLYNAMVAPLMPFTIKGVIWYQGTSNREWANEYLEQMKALIYGWRENWKVGDFPFYFLQLTAYKYSDSNLAAIIRENQLKTLEVPNTAMCPTMDIGDLNELHVTYKLPYGVRLANIALANSYHKKIDFCGPLFQQFQIKGDKIEITFSFNKNLHFTGEKLNDIFIAGKDKKFVKAVASIENNKLIVFSPDVREPVAVRYAWNNTREANLLNEANLPASPFRTDSWENIIIE